MKPRSFALRQRHALPAPARLRNVLVEVNNECDIGFHHAILQPDRVGELIARVRATHRDGHRLLVSTSFRGGAVPNQSVVRAADFLLLHGNESRTPSR